jgi:hypothetical protein
LYKLEAGDVVEVVLKDEGLIALLRKDEVLEGTVLGGDGGIAGGLGEVLAGHFD